MSSSNETENPTADQSVPEVSSEEQKASLENVQLTQSVENIQQDGSSSQTTDQSQSAEVATTEKNAEKAVVNPGFNEAEYAQHIKYNDKGVAIYTDPATKYQYQFDKEANQWVALDSTNQSAESGSQYENEYYRWCHEKNEWVLKETASNAETENEFYKWDAIKNQWIPKTTSNENIVSDFIDGVHTYTDKDGVVFFWDETKNAWFPKIDDDFMAVYQMNYGFIDNTSTTDGSGPSPKVSDVPKVEAEETKPKEEAQKVGVKRKPDPPKWFDLPPEHNTKVYVSNLPTDITEEEYVEVMSKYGMIVKDPVTNKLKVKLYTEPNGQLKGDGLCHYIKIESVELALNLLDGYDIRGHKIKVQRAQFQMRGEYNPALKPKKKKKEKEKMKKMQEKLFDWRPDKLRGERAKHEKIVILKNLFSPELFDQEVHLILEYQNDLREECSKCGTVRKVIIYDRHPEGVAQINMSDPEEADLVVQMMRGRYFGKRRLTAELWDGKTKYKINETENETNERLNKWDEFLEKPEEKRKDEKKMVEESDGSEEQTSGTQDEEKQTPADAISEEQMTEEKISDEEVST